MNAKHFRKLALVLPEAVETEHMQHPDLQVRKEIFATLGPDGDWGMVELTPVQQAAWVKREPKVFEPSGGAWGERGYTRVKLAVAKQASVRRALVESWFLVAPKRLAADYDGIR